MGEGARGGKGKESTIIWNSRVRFTPALFFYINGR